MRYLGYFVAKSAGVLSQRPAVRTGAGADRRRAALDVQSGALRLFYGVQCEVKPHGVAEPYPDMIERQTWTASVWQGVVAAMWVAVVALSAYAAVSVRDVSIVLDANNRSVAARSALSADQQMHADGKDFKSIAQFIIQRLESNHEMSAAVVDDSGKLVAGDKTALTDVPLPIIAKGSLSQRILQPPGFPDRLPFARGRVSPAPELVPPGFNAAFGGGGFGMIQQPAIIGGGVGSTVVRLSGGWLVISMKPQAMNELGVWYWPFAAAFTLLSFVTVWWIGKRTLIQTVRPMVRVERGLRRLVDVHSSTVEAIASDDVGLAAPLVESFNAAALELAAVLRQSSELEARIRQFVADAGHELRTPLTVIMGYVQLLRQRSGVDSPMTERVFSEIEGQGLRMTQLIQKLLLLTRLESQNPRDVTVVDAAEVVRSVADSFRPLAGSSSIQMHGDGSALVKISESEFRDIVGNLVDNAIKYAPGSTIDVTVHVQGRFIIVTVSDDGPGMSPELRARAFERFSRGETAGSVPGSGLGLAIVESAVERAGGAVSLQSAPGRGTTVELRFSAWSESAPAH